MLTRLKVSGFKNLVDVDVRFGPFTCIAGANGVGKSNLLDAIRFLSALASASLVDAALSIRDEGGRSGDVRSLFHCVGNHVTDSMSFEAEMLVPKTGLDDLGQEAKASTTFLRYSLVVARRDDSPGSLQIVSEALHHITKGETARNLAFPHKPVWRKSVAIGERRSPYISTADGKIKVHQDGGSSGKPRSLLASNLPRTALSAANAAESPTATLARREMQSWRLLQLEPSALRQPDSFNAPTQLGSDGSHLASCLYHLGRMQSGDAANVYAQVANRVAELIEGVGKISIDRDERRELLTLYLTDLDGTSHPARALSDGTLRFIALAVLERDPQIDGVVCLEEPENGIHPERIPAMLRLLQDIAVDPDSAAGEDNPLRQVIINTHSPAVVAQVPDDSLLLADSREILRDGKRFKRLVFRTLPNTWRSQADESHSISRGQLLSYLSPLDPFQEVEAATRGPEIPKRRRVMDRLDLQLLLPNLDTVTR